MLEFDLEPTRFRVRGGTYFLAPLTLDDAERISKHSDAPQHEQISAMADIVASKARSASPSWWLWVTRRLSPEDAVRSLSMPQQAKLFGQWMAEYRGLVPGESTGSGA